MPGSAVVHVTVPAAPMLIAVAAAHKGGPKGCCPGCHSQSHYCIQMPYQSANVCRMICINNALFCRWPPQLKDVSKLQTLPFSHDYTSM